MAVEAGDVDHACRAPRNAFQLMFDPVFGTIFWGKLFSSVGTWVHGIVAAIVIFDATGSALMVGLVTTVQFAPQLVLTPLSGKYADRGHAARQIFVGRLACLVGSAALAVWFAFGNADDPTQTSVAVLASTLVLGLGFVVGGPAMNSIVPDLIRPGELAPAMALNTLPMTLGRVVGPAVGAFVVAHSGPTEAFTIAAVLQGIFAIAILLAHLPRGERPDEAADLSIGIAFRYIKADKPIMLQLLIVAGMGCGAEPALTLAPAVADDLGGGAELVGELSAGFGGGAALGFIILSLLLRWWSSTVVTNCGLWTMSVGLGLAAFSHVGWCTIAAFVLVGIGFTVGLTSASTVVQERSPAALRGRIMAFWMIGFVGTRPLAALVNGVLADAYSVGLSILASALFIVVLSIVATPRRLGPAVTTA